MPALTLLMVLFAATATAHTIQGTVTYRERMVLPPGSSLEAVLEDVSRGDIPAEAIARTRLNAPGDPPIAFTIEYDATRIVADHHYVVRATIILDDRPLFITETAIPVITRGSPRSVTMTLRKAATTPSLPQTARPLDGTYWKVIELGGHVLPRLGSSREPHLLFKGSRLSGSDGCHKVTGAYQLTGDAVAFGPLAGAELACADMGNMDRMFQAALKTAERMTRAGDRLELSDATGRRVAAFVAATSPGRSSPAAADLTGTSWRLVMFQGGDGQTLLPDDRSKYTVDFATGGRVNTRFDCNRGSATWKSRGSNQLRFGTLATTHADCPAGSMHDQIVSQWGNVRSYVIKNGHLFLSLMADGGIYELEPVIKEPEVRDRRAMKYGAEKQ